MQTMKQHTEQFTPTTSVEDEQAIRQIVQALEDAWNTGDSEAWSAHNADSICHTVFNGHFIEGKAAVEAAHHGIFKTFYKDTQQKFTVRWVRFLRPDVAAVQFDTEMAGKGEILRARPLAVLTKQQDRWQIEIFQNTPIMPHPAAAENGRPSTSPS
jgi:uncharacterized protein (TIGR02246 family)